MSRDEGTVLDILNAATLILEFVHDRDLPSFILDAMLSSAVVHQFIVMGEATKRLSPEYRKRHPEVPWRQIAGLRDVLVHEYDEVDLEEIWRTATRDLPATVIGLSGLIAPRES